jgi:wyosine [tRNA(Phe)-imidazoG37] synthetase (radical SAM superfamily)
MGTILFDRIVFGPVKSRRLGNSLGLNLLPNDSKLCNYNCIYCECGWTYHSHQSRKKFHTVQSVLSSLEEKLRAMRELNEAPDSITFAGNGEPTIHPNFSEIVAGVLALRDDFFPSAKIAVLSNGTMIQKDSVYEALCRVDKNMLKLDTAIEETYKILNSPPKDFRMDNLIRNLQRFKGNFIIQTLFLKGIVAGQEINNGSSRELSAWMELVTDLNPLEVHIYSLARETPSINLVPYTSEKLKEIGNRLKEKKIKSFVFK